MRLNRIGPNAPRRPIAPERAAPLPPAAAPKVTDQLAIAATPVRKATAPAPAPKATPQHLVELDATIQMTLARGEPYRVSLAELVEKNLGPSATAVGKRLARKWIDNAAHHVFTDPHRWVVELAANAIDASRGTKVSAGQFGMGFLSCLEFLGHVETQGTRITIDTSTKDAAYRVTLSGKAADPEVRLEAVPKRATTGTTIRITPITGAFSRATVEGITRQLALLQFNPHAALASTTVSEGEIAIADNGPGMSTQVIATKLLMPSGSTKTRAAADSDAQGIAPELVSWAGKRDASLSYALVEIAGVVVVANEINPPVRDADGNIADVLLRMPHWTRVTLDRDEVILDSHGKSAEEAYLRKVIDAAIDQASTVGGPVSAAKLAALFTALRTWEDTSASSYLAGRPLTRHMKSQLAQRIATDERLVPMPQDDFPAFARAIAATTHTHRFLPLPGELVDYDYRRAETRIASLFPPRSDLECAAFDKRIIDGKTVVFVDPAALPKTRRGTPRITSFGLRDTLFVPRTYVKGSDAARLQRRIIHTYAAGFAQLRAPAASAVDGATTSLVERMLLVTNGTGPMVEEFDYFDKKARPWVATYDEAVAGAKAHTRFAQHQDAVRGFWPAYRDYMLHHHTMKLHDSNEHLPLDTLTSCLSSAFYQKTYNVNTREEGAHALANHGTICRDYFREQIAHVGLVVPGFDGPVSVDVDALWRELTPRLGDIQGFDWLDQSKQAYPHFAAIVDELVRDCRHVFRVHDPAPILQHHLQILFERHQLPDDAFVRLGTDVLWPLAPEAGAADVATLFGTLAAGLRDEHRRVELDSRRDTKRSLPGAEQVARVGELATMPLTLLHLTGPSAPKLAPARAAVLAPLVSGQLGLQNTVEYLDALRNGAGSLALLHEVEIHKDCSDELQVHLGRIEQALLHLSVKQLEVADGDIAGGYDRGRIMAVEPPLTSAASIRDLLTTWPASSLAKLVDLQRDHAATILDPQLRTTSLLDGCFPSYRLDAAFTPWATLARLRDKGIHGEHLTLLVDVCRNPAELIYAANVLERLEGGLESSASARSVLKAFVERLLQQRLDPHRLRAHAVELATNRELHRRSRAKAREHEALGDFAAELAAQVEGVTRIPSRDKFLPYAIATSLANAKPFSLSQLIAAQASDPSLGEALARGDLMGAVKCARDAGGGVTISKLTNNSEHGSERSPTQAALVETVQNSFDAVRAVQQRPDAPAREHGVDVGIDIVNAEDDRASLAISVRDSAGMPTLSTLLTDFILPDYSTKADTPGAVGVMGNGLFQLYADAAEVAMVTRLTSDPTKAYALLATPRRENGRIVDLELRCADVSSHQAKGQDFGSTLHVRMLPQRREAALYDAIYAQHFTRETLGAASVRGADGATIPLRLHEQPSALGTTTFSPVGMRASKNAAPSSGTRVNLTADEPLVTAALPDGKTIRILGREPATRVSQLTTAGVPVMDLARFCRQELLLPDNFVQFIDVGMALDLPLGSYTPVQSRTDLKLPEATREALRTALLDAVWLRVFGKQGADLEQIFQHFGSSTQFLRQVGITPRAVRAEVDAAIEARRPMNLVTFMTHHEGIIAQSFSALVASLLTHTSDVDEALGKLTQAYWQAGEALGPRIHAWTIEREVADHVEQARTVTTAAQRAAKDAMKSAMADMDPLTRSLAERAAVPWLDKKLDNAVGRLLRTFDDQVGSIQTAYAMAGPRPTSTTSPEELEAQRAAYAKKQTFVVDRLTGYLQALAKAHGTAAPPTLGFDAPPFAEGIFAADANHIGLNPRTYGVSALAADLDRLVRDGSIAPNSTLAKLILASPASSGTLNHELHHWRQRDGDAHAPGLTPDGDLVDFESCSTAHFRAFVAEGGLLAWIERGLS